MSPNVAQSFLSNAPDISEAVLAAKLSKISILKMLDEDTFCIQLIGAAQEEVKLLLGPPQHGSITTATFVKLPDIGWETILRAKQMNTKRLFADVGIFINQQGLQRWRFTESSDKVRQYGAQSWIQTILNRMANATEFFILELVGTSEDPVTELRKQLPPGRSLSQLTSSCPGMDDDTIARCEKELQDYKDWRLKTLLSQVSEGAWLKDGVEEVTSDNAAFVTALTDLVKPLRMTVMLS